MQSTRRPSALHARDTESIKSTTRQTAGKLIRNYVDLEICVPFAPREPLR